MQGTTQPIDRQTLLEKANKLIRKHEDTLAGIEATDVVQRNGVLVFSGEFYLDEQGLPTAKSTAVPRQTASGRTGSARRQRLRPLFRRASGEPG